MIVTNKISVDLAKPEIECVIHAVQDDKYSRNLSIALSSGGASWTIPEDAAVSIRYSKSDGKGGIYDTLPDGTTAWSVSGNVLTVALAPQVLTVAGAVLLAATLTRGAKEISTFPILLKVHQNVNADIAESENYFSVTGFMRAPATAKVGQYFRVSAIDEDGHLTAVEAVDAPEGSDTDAESVPSYVRAEAERLAGVVQSHQNENTFTFLAVSDPHHSLVVHPIQMEQSLKHCSQALAIVRQRVQIDFAAMLGDMIWDSEETPAQAMEAMRDVSAAIHQGFLGIPNFRTRGNHDCLSYLDEGLTDTQIFVGIGSFNAGAVFDEANRLGGYCYRDFEDHKLRVICVNNTETIDGGYGIGEAQLAWLPKALDLSEKGAGWKSILLSHCPMDEWGDSSAYMGILEAAEGLLCTFHGHLHNYLYGYLGSTGIPRVGIPNACFYRNNDKAGTEYGEENTYNKISGTKDETAFCVVTVDPVKEIVYADHYGAGYDRTIYCDRVVTLYFAKHILTNVQSSNIAGIVTGGESYTAVLTPNDGYILGDVTVTMGGTDITDQVYADGTVTIQEVTGPIVITASAVSNGSDDTGYTNVLPLATSTWGGTEIYNGIGYKTGTRLNSSVQEVAAEGMCLSGIIPIAAGDVIRIKNITVQGSQSSYVGTFNLVGTAGVTPVSLLGSPDSNGIYTWTNEEGWSAFRLSVGVIDDTTIITINEEIA